MLFQILVLTKRNPLLFPRLLLCHTPALSFLLFDNPHHLCVFIFFGFLPRRLLCQSTSLLLKCLLSSLLLFSVLLFQSKASRLVFSCCQCSFALFFQGCQTRCFLRLPPSSLLSSLLGSLLSTQTSSLLQRRQLLVMLSLGLFLLEPVCFRLLLCLAVSFFFLQGVLQSLLLQSMSLLFFQPVTLLFLLVVLPLGLIVRMLLIRGLCSVLGILNSFMIPLAAVETLLRVRGEYCQHICIVLIKVFCLAFDSGQL
mmetsp:Transcript_25500/g.42998  ORF Transcript_25500/g.42998 Transcript_25500/m.42998 type:complete len:254 (+) Transcript_25500:371-1132(+)